MSKRGEPPLLPLSTAAAARRTLAYWPCSLGVVMCSMSGAAAEKFFVARRMLTALSHISALRYMVAASLNCFIASRMAPHSRQSCVSPDSEAMAMPRRRSPPRSVMRAMPE